MNVKEYGDSVKGTDEVSKYEYILKMSAALNMNVMDWDISLFGDMSKKAINKALSEHELNNKIPLYNALWRHKARLTKFVDTLLMNRIKAINVKIANNEHCINDYSNKINTLLKEAYSLELQKEEARSCSNMEEWYKKLESVDPWWQYVAIYNDEVVWLSGECHQTYFKQSAGIDVRVYLGRFFLVVDMSTGVYKVLRAMDTIGTGHPHPHLNSNGSVCWGNVADAAHKAIISRDYATFTQLLRTLLNTYCPDNPYISLSNLKDGLDRNGRTPFHTSKYYDMLNGREPRELARGCLVKVTNGSIYVMSSRTTGFKYQRETASTSAINLNLIEGNHNIIHGVEDYVSLADFPEFFQPWPHSRYRQLKYNIEDYREIKVTGVMLLKLRYATNNAHKPINLIWLNRIRAGFAAGNTKLYDSWVRLPDDEFKQYFFDHFQETPADMCPICTESDGDCNLDRCSCPLGCVTGNCSLCVQDGNNEEDDDEEGYCGDEEDNDDD